MNVGTGVESVNEPLRYATADDLVKDIAEQRAKKLGLNADAFTSNDWKAVAISAAKLFLVFYRHLEWKTELLEQNTTALSVLRAKRSPGRPRKERKREFGAGIWLPPRKPRRGRPPKLETMLRRRGAAPERPVGAPVRHDYASILGEVEQRKKQMENDPSRPDRPVKDVEAIRSLAPEDLEKKNPSRRDLNAWVKRMQRIVARARAKS